MMNFVLKMMKVASKTMNFVVQMILWSKWFCGQSDEFRKVDEDGIDADGY